MIINLIAYFWLVLLVDMLIGHIFYDRMVQRTEWYEEELKIMGVELPDAR